MPKIRGIYQRGGSGAWFYDFQCRGHRFCGTTGTESRREAENIVKGLRDKAKSEVPQLRGDAPMSFGAAATRWWVDRGQHRKDCRDIERFLAWLQTEVGAKLPIARIDNNVVARLVSRRRKDDVGPATVNRSVVEPLRAILRHSERLDKPSQKSTGES